MLASIDANTVVKRVCCKGIWPTTPRDFVVSSTWCERRDGSIIIATRSVFGEHASGRHPDHPGYVRGRLVSSGYYIQPIELLSSASIISPTSSSAVLTPCKPGGCKVTLCAHTELGGSLPSSVINMLSTGAPYKIMESVRNILTKKSVK